MEQGDLKRIAKLARTLDDYSNSDLILSPDMTIGQDMKEYESLMKKLYPEEITLEVRNNPLVKHLIFTRCQ